METEYKKMGNRKKRYTEMRNLERSNTKKEYIKNRYI